MKPGDIANSDGDILLAPGPNPLLEQQLMRGIVIVTREQAEAAKTYGWKFIKDRDQGLVEIER